MKIFEITHPTYDEMKDSWKKWRLTYKGGDAFIEEYVKQFSDLENASDFADRKSITYIPAFAKSAINDIKNAIFQRTCDIVRDGATQTYKDAVNGNLNGVDNEGSTMNAFIGRRILPELLTMAKVGIYVDMPIVENLSFYDTKDIHPYLYLYKVEDILNWKTDSHNNLIKLLLRDTICVDDEEFDLPTDTTNKYRLLTLTPLGVDVTIFNEDGEPEINTTLNIRRIPFVIAEMSHSLLTDIANHQIALVNMASSDVSYSLKSNFPFYTEQYDPRSEFSKFLKRDTSGIDAFSGSSAVAETSDTNEITVGATTGRRYPINTERPDFINPSPEPLRASMEKQEQLIREIRQLVSLSLTNIEPRMASAESKSLDQQGLEAGLSYIGLELETAERNIAQIWAMYEGQDLDPSIKYPSKYNLQSDAERRKEANELEKLAHTVPSVLYKKALIKEIANITVGTRVSYDVLKEIHKEIEASEVINTNPEIIAKDVEVGLVDLETASLARGYPQGSVEKAKQEHAERLARIQAAQTNMSGARGIKDADITDSAKLEKQSSQNTIDKELGKRTRGKER